MEYLKFIPIIVLALAQAGTFAVAQDDIKDNKADIEELKKKGDDQIRMEEQMKNVREDLREIKQLIQQVGN